MSRKGGGGGSISGRGGGPPTPRNTMGGGVGGANGGANGGRYSHFKTVQTDAKYGMLMWQSKLQEKLLKEQKEKKQKELSSPRRKSDEDYKQQTTQTQFRAQNQPRFGTVPLRGGSGSGREGYNTLRTTQRTITTTTTTPAKNNSNNDIPPDSSHPKVNFHQNARSNEFRIEISRESADAENLQGSRGLNPTPTPTQDFERMSTERRNLDLREKLPSSSSPNESGSDFAGGNSKYLGDVQFSAYDDSREIRGRNENFNNSEEGGYEFNRSGESNREQDDVGNNYGGGSNFVGARDGGDLSRRNKSESINQNQYRPPPMPYHSINKSNAIPNLPKIVKPAAAEERMPKLNNSVSYDNLSRPLNSSLLPSHHHAYSQLQQQMQEQVSVLPAGRATPYNFSSNHAFFGLTGFGDGGAGGSGAGAPRRSPSGRVLTNLQGHPDIRYHQKDTRGFDQTLRYMMDKDRISQYREDLDKQVLENERARARVGRGSMSIPIKIMSSHENVHENSQDLGGGGESWRKLPKTSGPGMELAPLIRKYKSLPKLNTHKSSSDVTKQFVASPRRAGDYCLSPEPEEVAKGLSIQLAEKQQMNQITQENDRLAAEKHFNTWDSWWGRPGCGAPMFYYKNSRIGASTPSLATSRTNLFNALHMTHQKNKHA